MDGFPSGQRGQTVNLLAPPSKVRILLHPYFSFAAVAEQADAQDLKFCILHFIGTSALHTGTVTSLNSLRLWIMMITFSVSVKRPYAKRFSSPSRISSEP